MSMKKIIASRIEVLEFIKSKKIVSDYDLVDRFGYKENTASRKLYHLKDAGLVTSMGPNRWVLTEEAYRRLRYYGRG